jgi:crotonobetainyl-CoA:carnitine CoA-transferase CaiB-like acyl-CoA transferase
MIQAMLLQLSSREIIDKMVAAGIPCAPVLTVGEMMEDPHVKARNMIVEVDTLGLGKVKMPNIAVRLSETPGSIRCSAPRIGENTVEVLKECGFSEGEIQDFQQSKTVIQFKA